MHILVVEDERDLAAAIVKGLLRHGYTIDVAYDGEKALILSERDHHDLVILDLGLPKVDGLEVCRRIRASHPSTHILILTARFRPGAQLSGLAPGTYDYLAKPFHFPELLARVRAVQTQEMADR